MKPWWEKWPGLLEAELKALDEAGVSYTRDESQFAAGRLVLNVEAKAAGECLHLIAHYPDTYPYTRFEVIAPELNLKRHQNPFGKQLCLIGRATRNWNTNDTLAKYIEEQLPKVLVTAVAASPKEISHLEEPQGEPFTDYYEYVQNSSVFVDSSWSLDQNIKQGNLKIGDEGVPDTFRGAVLEVKHGDSILASAERGIKRLYQGKEIHGRWVRWPEPIRESNVQKIIAILAQKYPDLRHVKMQQGKNRGAPDIIGIVFSEEVRQGSYADAWIFLYRKGGANGVLRGSRAGRDDLAGRSPELRPLRAKRVAIIGLGSLGANSAIELARSGLGELRMADFDFVEAGTVSRWPLGLTAAGKNKIDVIEEFLRANYPHTNIITYPAMIGSAFPRQGYRDATEFEKLLDVDLIYDATTEVGIQHLLSDFASEHGIPYICISATPGAWGGMVARIRPGRTRGCWMCLQQAINAKEIPVPATHDSGHVQVTGCASPTFTGAGFDLAMVGLSGVRLAVSTLCDGVADDYPDVEWDLAIVDFREAGGRLIIPRWQTFTIERHRDCMNGITHPHCLDFANVA